MSELVTYTVETDEQFYQTITKGGEWTGGELQENHIFMLVAPRGATVEVLFQQRTVQWVYCFLLEMRFISDQVASKLLMFQATERGDRFVIGLQEFLAAWPKGTKGSVEITLI